MCPHSWNVSSLRPRLRTTKLAEYWGIARLALDQAEDRPPSVIRQAIPNDRFWAKQLGAASPAVDPSATLAVVISSPESGRSKPRTTTPVAAQCIAVFTKDVPTALPVVGHRMRRRVQLRAVNRIHHVVDRVAVVDLPFDMHTKFRCPALGQIDRIAFGGEGIVVVVAARSAGELRHGWHA